jgi:hypothetical protein
VGLFFKDFALFEDGLCLDDFFLFNDGFLRFGFGNGLDGSLLEGRLFKGRFLFSLVGRTLRDKIFEQFFGFHCRVTVHMDVVEFRLHLVFIISRLLWEFKGLIFNFDW